MNNKRITHTLSDEQWHALHEIAIALSRLAGKTISLNSLLRRGVDLVIKEKTREVNKVNKGENK